MAKQGAKQQVAANNRRLAILTWIVYLPAAVYAVVRFGLQWHTTSKTLIAMALFAAAVSRTLLGSLRRMAVPIYDETGTIADAGTNLSQGGMVGYYHDVLYITALTFVVSLLSDKGWLLYLCVPALVLVFLFQLMGSGPKLPGAGRPDTEAERKRQARAEKRAQHRARKRI
ncbi:unnamed protein product [Pedinophyceae sp. YPF-701]|nr:unnamed protein product [Pedinophyceae sp. YPF-701]